MQTTMICLQPLITCWHSGAVLHAGTATKQRGKECKPKLAQCKPGQEECNPFSLTDSSDFSFAFSFLAPGWALGDILDHTVQWTGVICSSSIQNLRFVDPTQRWKACNQVTHLKTQSGEKCNQSCEFPFLPHPIIATSNQGSRWVAERIGQCNRNVGMERETPQTRL